MILRSSSLPITIAVIVAILILLWRISIILTPKVKPLSLVDLKTISLQDSVNPAYALKVLSGNLTADFEKDKDGNIKSIKTLNILGEIKNISGNPVKSAVPIVNFLDKNGKSIIKKVGIYQDDYFLPELQPEDKYFYAVYVKNPPLEFNTVIVSFETSEKPNVNAVSKQFFISPDLKITRKDFEEKTASGSAGQQFTYYLLKGEIINPTDKRIKNAAVYAYLKDENNNVFSWGKQTFPSDLFEKNQTQQISITLYPQKEAKMESSEVFLFGEEL